MATKITVNGTTITVSDKKAQESVFAEYDEVSSAIAAAESATMVDVMSMAYESMIAGVETQAKKSGEAFGDKMKAAGAKIAAGAKRVWEAICKFFRNLIQAIEAFITGTAIKMRAKTLLAKLDKNGLNKAAKMKGTTMKGIDALNTKIANAQNKINGVPDAKCETAETSIPELDDLAKIVADIEKEAANFGAFQEAPKDTTVNAWDVFQSCAEGADPRIYLQTLSKGGTKIVKLLIITRDASKKALAVAMKEAKGSTSDKGAKKELVRKYKLNSKICNLQYKVCIKQINTSLSAVAAMVNAKAAGKDDSKAYQQALKKNANA